MFFQLKPTKNIPQELITTSVNKVMYNVHRRFSDQSNITP